MNDNEKKLIAKEVWASELKAKEWLARGLKIKNSTPEEVNTDIQSINVLIEDLKRYNFKTFLEVGAGNGRLIGTIARKFLSSQCYSVDINPHLSKHVSDTYPTVITSVGDASDLSQFKDDSFDLVYTYQVLQHVPPTEIQKVLSELKRVAKKEVWIMEGHDPEYSHVPNGFMRKGTDGGTFVYRFGEMLNCYSITQPKSNKLENMGVKLYKITV